MFDLNKDTGVITTKGSLDYEDIRQHILFIRAEDKSVSERSGKRGFDIVIIEGFSVKTA